MPTPTSDKPQTLKLWRTKPKTVGAAMKRIHELLRRPGAWTTGSWAKNCENVPVPALDPLACKVCLEGAVYRACNAEFLTTENEIPNRPPEDTDPLVGKVFERIRKAIDKLYPNDYFGELLSLYTFNDDSYREFADVQKVVKRAEKGVRRVRKN